MIFAKGLDVSEYEKSHEKLNGVLKKALKILGAKLKRDLKINNDNTATYTFKLKPNLHWVSNQSGKKYADVVAEDFITSAKYILDNKEYCWSRRLL